MRVVFIKKNKIISFLYKNDSHLTIFARRTTFSNVFCKTYIVKWKPHIMIVAFCTAKHLKKSKLEIVKWVFPEG